MRLSLRDNRPRSSDYPFGVTFHGHLKATRISHVSSNHRGHKIPAIHVAFGESETLLFDLNTPNRPLHNPSHFCKIYTALNKRAGFELRSLLLRNPPNQPLPANFLPPQCIHSRLGPLQKRLPIYDTIPIRLHYPLSQQSRHDLGLELLFEERVLRLSN